MRDIKEEIEGYIKGEVTMDELTESLNKLILSIIYRYNFNSKDYSQQDLVQESWLHVFEVLQSAKTGEIIMNNPFNYIYTSIKNKLIKLTTDSYTMTTLPDEYEIEDTADEDYNYELVYNTFIDYLKHNRQTLFFKEYNKVILQEYINKFENEIYSPSNVNCLNNSLHLDLPRTYTHSSVKRVKYKLNAIYQGIREDVLQGKPNFKIMRETYG